MAKLNKSKEQLAKRIYEFYEDIISDGVVLGYGTEDKDKSIVDNFNEHLNLFLFEASKYKSIFLRAYDKDKYEDMKFMLQILYGRYLIYDKKTLRDKYKELFERDIEKDYEDALNEHGEDNMTLEVLYGY